MNKNCIEFPVSVYGKTEKISELLTKARCRIFYKGANRNGTFITDNFAEELISSLSYTPIKGIYGGQDYTDHGKKRVEGRIYGIVPETKNFAWEQHLDEDGVERTYACTDVYLFTALYPEAGLISGKGQSMELYEPSLQYHTSILEGQKYIVFEHGCFLGLQVLGDNVEPCFEGAAFYSLKELQKTIEQIKNYSLGGKPKMSAINFKLSDDQKYSILWNLLNPNYNEENNWTCDYAVSGVYDDYVIAYNYENDRYERVYYTKDDKEDKIELGERVEIFIIDVTQSEKSTVETLRSLNGGTYDLVSEELTNAKENAEKCISLNTKIEENLKEIGTLNMKIEEEIGKYSSLENELQEEKTKSSELSKQIEELTAYKKGVEDHSKEAIISEYTNKLSEEVLETFKNKFDDFSVEELDMHLAYELKKSNNLFTDLQQGRLPKNESLSGVEKILSRYKK